MRKVIIVISCCTVLLLLGYTGYRGYRVWKENHWMSMAKGFAAKPDNRNALLCLQQVLRLNSRNAEACRMVAGLNELTGSPNALVWRYRALELNPKSLEDRLALAKTALIIGNYAAATNALDAVDAAGQKTASYHILAGIAANATGQAKTAEFHFSEASRLEPWNPAPVLNLSVVRLQGTNTLDMAEARIALKRVSMNSTNMDLRCQALRELVADAVRLNQVDSALGLSEELLRQTNSIFRDRLLRLDVLRETKQASFKPTLAGYQRETKDDEGKIFELAKWQMGRLGPAEALGWLTTLPSNTQTNPSVARVMAECRVMLKDWRGIQLSLDKEKQNWVEFEFMRHAVLAQALRNLELVAAAKAEWGLALQSVGNQKRDLQRENLARLLQFAAQANWSSEAEELLWNIVNQFPEDQTSAKALARVLFESGRTRPLLKLFVLQSKRKPADLSLKNNLAMTALLLDAQELKPHDLAREVYLQSPTNSAFTSTYAFSLHLQKKDAEALKVMQQLPPKALENPSISGYYGLVLKATGDPAKAGTYLNWAFKSTLLPEEKKLFEAARSGTR